MNIDTKDAERQEFWRRYLEKGRAMKEQKLDKGDADSNGIEKANKENQMSDAMES